jgi:hypothetical protein
MFSKVVGISCNRTSALAAQSANAILVQTRSAPLHADRCLCALLFAGGSMNPTLVFGTIMPVTCEPYHSGSVTCAPLLVVTA